MNSVNKELKRVLGKGNYTRIHGHAGEADLKEEFDYAYHIKTDGNIFELQTQRGWFSCPLNEVDWKQFWSLLGDIPLSEDGEIEEDFEHFWAGEDQYDIWDWFEWFFDITLGDEIYS